MLEGVLYQIVSRAQNSAVVRYLPQSPIYAAHFPGYPITPGVTIVQTALELMGCHMTGAKEVKFMVPVFPASEARFEWALEDGQARVNVFLEPDTLCAKMTLSV